MAIMRGIDTKVQVTCPAASRKLADLEVSVSLGGTDRSSRSHRGAVRPEDVGVHIYLQEPWVRLKEATQLHVTPGVCPFRVFCRDGGGFGG